MNTISTTEEFLQQMRDECLVDFMRTSDREKVEKKLREFVKLHLKAQQEAILKKLESGLETHGLSLTDDFGLELSGKDLITSAYNINDIK